LVAANRVEFIEVLWLTHDWDATFYKKCPGRIVWHDIVPVVAFALALLLTLWTRQIFGHANELVALEYRSGTALISKPGLLAHVWRIKSGRVNESGFEPLILRHFFRRLPLNLVASDVTASASN
jgi:hypothetical protein